MPSVMMNAIYLSLVLILLFPSVQPCAASSEENGGRLDMVPVSRHSNSVHAGSTLTKLKRSDKDTTTSEEHSHVVIPIHDCCERDGDHDASESHVRLHRHDHGPHEGAVGVKPRHTAPGPVIYLGSVIVDDFERPEGCPVGYYRIASKDSGDSEEQFEPGAHDAGSMHGWHDMEQGGRMKGRLYEIEGADHRWMTSHVNYNTCIRLVTFLALLSVGYFVIDYMITRRLAALGVG